MDAKIAIRGGRRERKKEETRRKIIQVATELFSGQGFEAITMEQIAEAVDISKVTLYNYFPVKEAIATAFIQDLTKSRTDRVDAMILQNPDTRTRLSAYLATTTQWVQAHEDIYRAYVSYRLQHLLQVINDQAMRSGFEAILAMIIQAGQEQGEIRTDIPLEILARNLEMMLLLPHVSWLADPDSFPLEPQIAVTMEIFLNGAARCERRGKHVH